MTKNTTYTINNWGDIKVGETYSVYELEMLRHIEAGDSLGWATVDMEEEREGIPQILNVVWEFKDREIEALKKENENGYVINEEEIKDFVKEKYGKSINELEGIVTFLDEVDAF